MKVVYFIRHAKSSWDSDSLRDMDRPLNERGLRDAPFMANLLTSKGIPLDGMVSSPANRAYTTATYFAKAFGLEASDIKVMHQIYESSPATILAIIRQLPNTWNTIFIFGHNPTFTDVVNQFAGRVIDNIPTCGIAKVEDEVQHWEDFGFKNARLTAFYYPKQHFI